MITPQTYGFGGRSNAAYYWMGLSGGGNKYPGGGTFGNVEAGMLSGLNTTTFSNLPLARVQIYGNPVRVTRFIASSFSNFVGLWGQSRAVFPVTLSSWNVWGPVANAT